MEAKLLFVALIFIVAIPAGILLSACSKKVLPAIFIVGVISLCEPDSTAAMLISRPFYRSITRGLEISLLDLTAIVLCIGIFLRHTEFKIRWAPPLLGTYLIFLTCTLLSYTQTVDFLPQPSNSVLLTNNSFETRMYPIFEITKVIRGILFLWITVTYLSSKNGLKHLSIALLICMYYLTIYSIINRYIYGAYRVAATMDHSNVLGTFMIPLSCATMGLAIFYKKHYIKCLFFLATAGGLICAILTVSRGALVFWLVATLILVLLLIPKCNKLNNALYVAVATIFICFAFAKSFDSLNERFSQNSSRDYSLRDQYNIEAIQMAQENFWGVGMGNFSAWSWHRYAAMNIHRTEGPGVPAHSMWYLTLGELGYPGLIVLILIWLRYLILVGRLFFKKLSYYHYTWLCISLAGIFGVLLQESLNNCYRHTSIYFLVQIFTAIPIAIYYLEKDKKKDEEKCAAEPCSSAK